MKLAMNKLLRSGNWLGLCVIWMAVGWMANAQGFSTTTVQGTVYSASGQPGTGTLQLSWPAFTTANNQAVAAGRKVVTIGSDGFVSVNLAPNVGATPAGLYYTAIYNLSDGTTSTEYWVVPAAAQASPGQVRAQVMPAAQAVQTVSKHYVDQSIQELTQSLLTASGGSLSGPLYLNGDPQIATQAADKHYVDGLIAQAVPLSGATMTGPLTSVKLGGIYQADQFTGADFGAKLQSCISGLDGTYGGTCDARNFTGALTMGSDLSISTANVTVQLPCATISTAHEIVITAGTRNVTFHGCALRGASAASGSQGGTVFLYSGGGAMVQVGDPSYAIDTPGFHMDNAVINTTASNASTAQAIVAYRTQEMDLEHLYLLGNSNQTGLTLDGTGNYTGGTFQDNQFDGFGTALNAIGHQTGNSATTDWMNASTFVRLHINCPTSGGNPVTGTYGINLQQGDGNTFTGGDVEGCSTALHLGVNAQNNTFVGLRNENSNYQVVADAGSSYNSWMTGGTMFTGKLMDNGARNSFLDTFHRSFNGVNGDWYGSQQDATVTNHYRIGIGTGNERGLLNRYQTDSGYRWTTGLSDATSGQQFYQVLDELNQVYRLSIGQYNNGQSSTNNQTVINAAGTGAVVLNGSANAGTGGVVFGAGGSNGSTVATINNAGNAQFNGSLQVGGLSTFIGSTTVKNQADAEVDAFLWAGATTSQKESLIYKDWNGGSQWYMVKDASNNWALNSATGGLDSFKAYQSTNSGDTYINASNGSGHIRLNYETGSGAETDIYSGSSSSLVAAFLGTTAIKLPGLASANGRNCLQIDSSGYITNTGATCGTGSSVGTVNAGTAGQIAYYSGNGTAVAGTSAVSVTAGGTGATTAADALAHLGAQPALPGVASDGATGMSVTGNIAAATVNASVNSLINVMAAPYNAKGDCSTDDTPAITAAQAASLARATGLSWPAPLYFPKPPGGCYLLNTQFVWLGVSLEGQTPNNPDGIGHGGVVLLSGIPGADVLSVPDPTTTANSSWRGEWSIKHLTLRLNTNTPTVTHPHRWPGRWFDDGAMTAGSNMFKSTRASISCGDIGQPIQVNGAGVGGANLVSTITSVFPCWAQSGNGFQTVQLADNASTTVLNAHSYISVHGIPVTANISGCGIGMDNQDGNPANWVSGAVSPSGGYSIIEDVAVNATTGSTNNTCGFFFQGAATQYGLTMRNVSVGGTAFGIVGATAELNSWYQSNMGDFDQFDHLHISATYPWITYNGLGGTINIGEFHGAFGPAFLVDGNQWGDTADGWNVNQAGYNGANSSSLYGWRVNAGGWHVRNSGFAAYPTQVATLDMWNSILTNDTVGVGTLALNGYGNKVDGGTFANTTDNGLGNVWEVSNTSAFDGFPKSYRYATKPYKGAYRLAGRVTPDFVRDGNPATPYNYDDLFIFPHDIMYNSYGATDYGTYFVADSTSPAGMYWNVVPGSDASAAQFFEQFAWNPTALNHMTIGTNVPATKATVYFLAKCLNGVTSGQFNVGISGGGFSATSLGTDSFTCTSSYAPYSLTVDFSPYTGAYAYFQGTGTNTFQVAWFGVRPYQADYNGSQPALLTPTTMQAFNGPVSAPHVTDTSLGTSTSPVCPNGTGGAFTTTGCISSAGIPSVPYWLQFLGDGSEGALNVTSGTMAFQGEHWYSSINIAPGATLYMNSGVIATLRSTGSCTVAGTISVSANSSAYNGITSVANYGGNGGSGGSGSAAGAAGLADLPAGTAAASVAGGVAGNPGTTPGAQYQRIALSGFPPYVGEMSATFYIYGGSAGGAGGTSGGAGGKGGGMVILDCASINFTGTIDVSGTAGGNAPGNSSGAGGGGGGGFVIMRSPNFVANSGTINVSGGAGGTCGAFTGCGAGGAGGNGWYKQFIQ